MPSSSSDKTPGRDSRRFAARVARCFSGKVSASFCMSTIDAICEAYSRSSYSSNELIAEFEAGPRVDGVTCVVAPGLDAGGCGRRRNLDLLCAIDAVPLQLLSTSLLLRRAGPTSGATM